MTATDGLVDDAPDCARCSHPAEHHTAVDTGPSICFTDVTGEQVPRFRDVECKCAAYLPTAAPGTVIECPACAGSGLDPCDRALSCPDCVGTGQIEMADGE